MTPEGAPDPSQLPPPLGLRADLMLALHASRRDGHPLHDSSYVEQWVAKHRQHPRLNATLIPLKEIEGWHQVLETGNICHSTGRFFSVIGLHCRHRVDRDELEWDQPIIEQPETGILGILAKSIDGVLHFCLQAKEEPGNIGGIQLSPTVQATYSNYTGAHGGATPPFLDQFMGPEARRRTIFARLQTEDGGRFLYKSNRNMIVEAADDFPVELPDHFIWLTLWQIADLLHRDNLVNACARSILSSLVLAGAPLDLLPEKPAIPAHHVPKGIWETLQWLDDRRAANHMLATRIGLFGLLEWRVNSQGFFAHCEDRFFRIVGIRISSAAREVGSWCQPIIENPEPGVIGLLLRTGPRGLELLMQAKAEVGNKITVQLGPTGQFTQGNYADSTKLKKPFLFDEFLTPGRFEAIHETCQPEEGARFYRECHRHRIMMLPKGEELALPDDYRWLPLSHVLFLVHLGEQVNSCARSILTCLL